MWLLYIFIGYILIQIIIGFLDKIKEKIRNKVTTELFSDTKIEIRIENSKNKLNNIIGENRKEEKPISLPEWQLKKLPKYINKIYGAKCPECKDGYLKVSFVHNRFGSVASSFYCSHNPSCNFKIGLQEAKEKFEKKSVNLFKEDFNRVYS